MLDLGINLQLLLGPTVPLPAPYSVVDALVEVEVENKDQEFDGFKLTFTLGKDSLLDYGLLLSGRLDPPSRAIIVAIINGRPQVLIDGFITRHEFVPSNRPGESKLYVYGKDITMKLDLEEKNETYSNQSDSLIATRILPTLIRDTWIGAPNHAHHRRAHSGGSCTFATGHRSGFPARAGETQRLRLLHRANSGPWSQHSLLGA